MSSTKIQQSLEQAKKLIETNDASLMGAALIELVSVLEEQQGLLNLPFEDLVAKKISPQPGDVVVLSFPRGDVQERQIRAFRRSLAERCPEIRFVVVVACELAVAHLTPLEIADLRSELDRVEDRFWLTEANVPNVPR